MEPARHSPIGHDQCHVFVANAALAVSGARREHADELLDEAERARRQRFRTEALKWRFTLGHALMRIVLGEYTGCKPAALQFSRSDRNRPALDPAPEGFDFNLSYTADAVAFGCGRFSQIGVDIERIDRRVDWQALSRRVLTPAEIGRLQRLPQSDASTAFFEIWVLKEAYSKALGIGVGLGFNTFTLMHEAGHVVCADLATQRDWCFELYGDDAGHRLAIAANTARLDVVWHEPPFVIDLDARWRLLARMSHESGVNRPQPGKRSTLSGP